MKPPTDIDTSERPVVLVWEVTQACDLACEHCRAEAKPDRHPDELTTAEGRTLLNAASQFGENQLVVLSGGDPLYRDDIHELVRYGVDQGLRMTLTPSGTASLNAEQIQRLASAGLSRMALSIDGATAESHDAFRGEAGSYEQTLTAAREAKKAGLPLQINTTVCAQTADDLPAIRDLVADLGAVLWSVFFLVPIGRGSVLDPVSPTRAEAIMEWLVSVSQDAPFGIKTTEAPHYRRVMAQVQSRNGSDGSPKRRAGVTAGNGFAFVSHTGEMYPSGFLPVSAGNVRETSPVTLYREAQLFERLRDPNELSGKCGACEFRHLCGGSRSRAYAYSGDPMASDPLCNYIPDGFDGEPPEQSLS